MKSAFILLSLVCCSSSVLSYSPNCFVELGRAVDSKAEKGSKVCRLFDELLSCEAQDSTFDLSAATYKVNDQPIETAEYYEVCAAKSQWSAGMMLVGFFAISFVLYLKIDRNVMQRLRGKTKNNRVTMSSWRMLFLLCMFAIFSSCSPENGQVHEVHPIGDAGIMLISTIDGYITAIDAETGRDKWRFKEAPILESPISIQQGFTFIPNPRDGQLYLVVEGRLSKLPFTIPQLVKVSPCRSNDGILYAGNKKDVWMAINPETGERTETFSSPTSNSYCPVSDPNTVFIGKTEYHLSMMDTKKRDRQWNATFVDYSSHLLPAESQYPFQHFTSSADGSLLTVDGLTGEVLWERQFNTVIVNMYLLKEDGMHKLPSTAIGKETFDALIGVGSFTNFEKIMALLLHGKYKRQKW
uniref:Pyrrolo-quinoline quinone repeat domain-containing protein n=1 Tax=Ditylenchus dipsaci TaxID=166011 RepID=A0A915CV82_9BILA